MNGLGRALLASWVVIAGAICCSTSATPVTDPDSETHWLHVCNADADCDRGLSCWCGICTSLCSSDTECTKLAKGATCANDAAAKAVCGGGISTKRACVLPCDTAEACASLGAHASCAADGVCRASTLADGGVLTCSERLTVADQRAYAVISQADATCATDADCVFSSTISCGTACFPLPISRTGAADIAPALAELDPVVCEPISAAGCAVPTLFCPAPGTLRCVAKRCLSQGLGGCDSCIREIPPPTCGKRIEQMLLLSYEYVARADTACSVDSDCTAVPISSACLYECAVAVSKSSAPALESALAGIESSFCPSYFDDGCTLITNMIGCPHGRGEDGGVPVRCLSNTCQ